MTQTTTECPQLCLLCHTYLRSPGDHSEFWLAYPTARSSHIAGVQRLDERLECVLNLALCEVGEEDAAVCASCVDRLRAVDRLLTEIRSLYQVSHLTTKTRRHDGGWTCTKRDPSNQTYRRDVGTQVSESDLCSDLPQKPTRQSKRSLAMKPRRNTCRNKTVGSTTVDASATAAEKVLVEAPGSDPGDMMPPDAGAMSDSEHEAEDTISKLGVTPQNNQITSIVVEAQQDMKTGPETVKVRSKKGNAGVKCFTCDTCMASFTKRDKLKRHLRTHSGEKPFECGACGKRFAAKYQMQRHHTQVHTGERRYRCSVCQHGFTELRPLQIHMRRHTGERPYRCSTCHKTFSQAYSLKLHRLIHTGQLPYKCSWCSAGFSRGDSLKIHVRRHTGEKPYVCGTCDMRFADPQNLKKHTRTHAATRQRTYKCTVCAAAFFRAHSLKEHAWKHSGQRRYLCSVCGTSFAHLSSLNHHVKSHTDNKPHSCPHCHATFRDPRVLKVHVRKHTGERPFRCGTCDKGFAHHGQLNRHKLTHTGERPHHCLKCSKKFARKDKLQRHCQVIHGTCPDTLAVSVPVKSEVKAAPTDDIQRPHGCSMCGKHYTRKDKLKAHMAKIHHMQPSGPGRSTSGRGQSDLALLVSQTPVVLSSATSVSQIGTSQVLSPHNGESNFIQNTPQSTQKLQQLNSPTFQNVPTLSTIPNTIHRVTPASGHSVRALTVSQHNLSPLTASQNSVTPLTASQNSVTPLTASQNSVTPLTASQNSVTPLTASQHTMQPFTMPQLNVTALTVPPRMTPFAMAQHSVTPLTVSQNNVTPLTVSQNNVTPLTVSHHNIRPFTLSQQNVTPLTVSQNNVTPLTVSHHNIRPFTLSQQNVTPLTVSQNNVTLLTVSQSHTQPSHTTPLIVSQPGVASHLASPALPHIGMPYSMVSQDTSHPLNVSVRHVQSPYNRPTN